MNGVTRKEKLRGKWGRRTQLIAVETREEASPHNEPEECRQSADCAARSVQYNHTECCVSLCSESYTQLILAIAATKANELYITG